MKTNMFFVASRKCAFKKLLKRNAKLINDEYLLRSRSMNSVVTVKFSFRTYLFSKTSLVWSISLLLINKEAFYKILSARETHLTKSLASNSTLLIYCFSSRRVREWNSAHIIIVSYLISLIHLFSIKASTKCNGGGKNLCQLNFSLVLLKANCFKLFKYQ